MMTITSITQSAISMQKVSEKLQEYREAATKPAPAGLKQRLEEYYGVTVEFSQEAEGYRPHPEAAETSKVPPPVPLWKQVFKRLGLI